MAKPMGKRRTKRTYLGSGAGSLRSGTGATAKKPKSQVKKITNKIFKEARKSLKATDSAVAKFGTKVMPGFHKPTPKSPASGFNSVFDDRIPPGAKRRRKKTAQTIRKKAKR